MDPSLDALFRLTDVTVDQNLSRSGCLQTWTKCHSSRISHARQMLSRLSASFPWPEIFLLPEPNKDHSTTESLVGTSL